MQKLKLSDICIDGGTQCRAVIDQPTVYHYVEQMKEGDVFPRLQIICDGVTNWLTDGFHRWHAYKILGIKEIEVDIRSGTKEEAFLEALKANSKHGKPLSNADKKNKVLMALAIPGYAEKSHFEIARICELSQSFVASVRNPEVKARQQKNRDKSAAKAAKQEATTSPTSNNEKLDGDPDPYAGAVPDENEIRAAELAQQANFEAMNKLLDSDDSLKVAYEEIKRLNHLNAQLELRLHGLMNERNEAVKMVKKLQKELDKKK